MPTGKPRLKRLRFSRFLGAATTFFILVVFPMIAVILAATLQPSPHATSHVLEIWVSALPWWLILAFALSIVFLCLHTFYEYQRRTYDPTWAFQFLEEFNSDDFIEYRGTAATLLKDSVRMEMHLREKNLKPLTDIDPVLDMFDSIGFYHHGGQISSEVVHQEFFYWIRGYYQAAHDYIEARQVQEAATWDYVPELYETCQEIEAKMSGKTFKRHLTKERLADFLDE
jgi:hypothetical protein